MTAATSSIKILFNIFNTEIMARSIADEISIGREILLC
jgi:hypothetical protein